MNSTGLLDLESFHLKKIIIKLIQFFAKLHIVIGLEIIG